MTLKRLLVGGLAGLAATVPMTVVMLAIQRRLPEDEQYALPQQEIADTVAGDTGTHDDRDSAPEASPSKNDAPALDIMATLAHFGYGTAMGGLYAVTLGRGSRRPAARGILFGLLLWAGSYLGWLPAMGILTPATQHPPRRNAMMIVSHLVWGATAGLLTHRWEEG